MADNTLREIEQFLYQEVRLLDNRQYHRWLELLTEDVRYWMPMRSNRYAPTSKALASLDETIYETGHDTGELTAAHELAIMDETKDSLRRRVERLDSGLAWAEDPPSRTRHFLSNIEAYPAEAAGEMRVYSNFILYRTRGEREQDFYVGSREDLLRPAPNGWQLAYRKVILDQNVLLAKNVSNFF